MMSTIRSSLAQFGPIGGALYLIDTACLRFTNNRIRVHAYHFIAQPVNVKLPIPRRVDSTFTTRLIPEEESHIMDFLRPHAVLRSRYVQGAICLAAFKEQDFAGCLWLLQGAYKEDEVKCRYQPQPSTQTTWDFDLYIPPEFRRGFVFLKLWASAFQHLRDNRIRWSLSRVSVLARNSLASHRRMGAKRIGSAFFLKVFGVQLTLSTIAPFVHLNWGHRHGPLFVLKAE